MRPTLIALLLTVGALAADFTGNWASAPMYVILKQDGNKLSGSGGPTAKDQQLFFDNGTVDGNRASFKIGAFQVGSMEGVAIPMRNLAEVLSRQMSRPVLDMTGLKGFYSFTMTFAPDEAPAAPVAGEIPESAVGPSLARALQDQLGLRLEPRRAPVDMLIVDHAGKVPVEN